VASNNPSLFHLAPAHVLINKRAGLFFKHLTDLSLAHVQRLQLKEKQQHTQNGRRVAAVP
jgi:hypothetical protein